MINQTVKSVYTKGPFKVKITIKGSRPSGDLLTTVGNTKTTRMFFKVCFRLANIPWNEDACKFSGDDSIVCLSTHEEAMRLKRVILENTSRDAALGGSHSGFAVKEDELVVEYGRGVFTSKILLMNYGNPIILPAL
jgi:hypothetical protein